jgi:hypothetical protein
MQFALLIYESPEAFAARNSDGTDPYTGAWRAYYNAMVEAGIYVGGDPLQVPETGTTVRRRGSTRCWKRSMPPSGSAGTTWRASTSAGGIWLRKRSGSLVYFCS